MKDQATSLRNLVQGKTEYAADRGAAKPTAAPVKPVFLTPQPSPPPRTARPPFSPSALPAAAPSLSPWETLPSASPPVFRPIIHRSGEARIVAVTSGKGGVGKTNLTVNLAIALAREGQRVIIIDADLGMANVDVVLGTVSKYHLMHLLQPDISLEDVLIHGPYGVNYISGGSAIERAVELSAAERQQLMDKLTVCGEMADIILVDTGAGLGQSVLDFILAADEVLLVTTPEPTALTDAYAVMKAYSLHADNKNLRIIVNRVYDEAESRDVLRKLQRTAERFLRMPLEALGSVYEDRNVMNAVKRQSPLLAAYPHTLASRCVEAIAKNLLYGGRHEVEWGWRGFLQRLLKFKD